MPDSSIIRRLIAVMFVLVTLSAEAASVTARSSTAECGRWSKVDLTIDELAVFDELSFTVVYDPAQLTLVTMIARFGSFYEPWVDVGSEPGSARIRIRPPKNPAPGPISASLFFKVPVSSASGAATVQITDVRTHLPATSYAGTGSTFFIGFDCARFHPPLPGSPQLNAEPQSHSSVVLSWSKVSGVDAYAVYRGATRIRKGAGSRYVDTNLTSGQEYCYTVRSVGENGESADSNRVCVTTLGSCVVPEVVADLAASPRGMSKAALVWSAVPGANQYAVFRDGALVYEGLAPGFDDYDLTAGTKYCYTVRTTSSCGSSEMSPPACVTTEVSCEPPAAAPIVNATVAGAAHVALSWPEIEGATEYRVTRNRAAVHSGAEASFVDSTLRAETIYCYVVTATNACGVRASSEQCVTTGSASGVSYTFARLLGTPGGPGGADGLGPAASFLLPQGVAIDATGNAYVADTDNHVIRKITPAGMVSTVAGAVGRPGSSDGAGGRARFNEPYAIAIGGDGTLYISDSQNHTIRTMTPAGKVTTLAGSAGLRGRVDGAGSDARFYEPSGIAFDGTGNLYVADHGNHSIRKVTPAGVVTTRAGTNGFKPKDGPVSVATFTWPRGVVADRAGNLFVTDTYNNAIRMISTKDIVSTFAGRLETEGFKDGVAGGAFFRRPEGITIDSAGNLYVADTDNAAIRKVTPKREVTTVAGGAEGYLDGPAGAARFFDPVGVAVDSEGNVLVADKFNSVIRRLSTAGGVTTFAGSVAESGSADGSAQTARLRYPGPITVDHSGNLYFADYASRVIRKMTPQGVVSTLAGTPGKFGTEDGVGAAATFYGVDGLAVDGVGNVYVTEPIAHTIRRITPEGVVSTYAGEKNRAGSTDGLGTAAHFYSANDIAADIDGNLYVADTYNCTIRKISPQGVVSTIAGVPREKGSVDGTGPAARFNNPRRLTVDREGTIFVADEGGRIRKVTPTGTVTTLVGSEWAAGSGDGAGAAVCLYTSDLAVDVAGNLLVVERSSVGSLAVGSSLVGPSVIRKVTPDGIVTHLAGSPVHAGNVDGDESVALFNRANSIAIDGAGNIYISETVNHGIRRATLCASDALCFDDGNFSVSLTARDPRTGETGAGKPIPQTDLFGFFSLPDLTGNPENPEVFVKILDGREVNGSYWVFHGGLTDLEYVLFVTDLRTNEVKAYRKEPFGFCGGADTSAFRRAPSGVPTESMPSSGASHSSGELVESSGASSSQPGCGSSILCLGNGRFTVQLAATDPRTGKTSSGTPIPQNDMFGFFSLPDLTGNARNPEVFVKVLDGRGINGRFWVFYGGLTDLQLTLTVSDGESGAVQVYTKLPYSVCGGADTSAF